MGMFVLGLARVNAQTLLYTESFETDGEGTRYTSNSYIDCSSGNQDYFVRANTTPALPTGCALGHFDALTGVQGTFYWASEDIRSSIAPPPGARLPGDITTNSINIASYTALNVSLFLATAANNGVRWEASDSLNVQASINGGAFRTVGRFCGDAIGGGNLRVDANLDGIGEGAIASINAFTQYTFNIAGTGNTLRVRLDYDQLGGFEEMGTDRIEVRGTVVVPVKWASFTGHQVDETVKLDWATTEEVNVREFQVERLTGDGTFQPIGGLLAKGQAGTYGYVDQMPASGANLYRIRQVDLDNTFSYSDVIEVQVAQAFRTVLYPNPMHDGCRLVIEGESVSGTLTVMDNAGRLMRSNTFERTNELQIERGSLPAGLYHLRLDLENGRSFAKKLMIHD